MATPNPYCAASTRKTSTTGQQEDEHGGVACLKLQQLPVRSTRNASTGPVR